jgi:hypothetical protein
VVAELGRKVTVTEAGKSRQLSKAEAIAIQLVNRASTGDPKGLAAILAITREFDAAITDFRTDVFTRAEDADVVSGILARLSAALARTSTTTMDSADPEMPDETVSSDSPKNPPEQF